MSRDHVVRKTLLVTLMLLATCASWASRSSNRGHTALADVSARGFFQISRERWRTPAVSPDAAPKRVPKARQDVLLSLTRGYEEWQALYKAEREKARLPEFDPVTESYSFFTHVAPHPFPTYGDWFVAKETLMFRHVGEWYQKFVGGVEGFTYDSMVATACQDLNPLNYAVTCMARLVDMRTRWICKVLFNSDDPDCLFSKDREKKPVDVKIPMRIEAQGSSLAAHDFTDSQQKCKAKALGSVSVLSDLDFTVQCYNEACADSKEEARQAAMDEIEIAQTFASVVLKVLKKPAGIVFDTNFYTDTFRYAPHLAPTKDPAEGFAMALYAAAHGLHDANAFINHAEALCPELDPYLASGTEKPDLRELPEEIERIKTRYRTFPKPSETGDLKRTLGFVLANDKIEFSNLTTTDARTDVYYSYLREAIESSIPYAGDSLAEVSAHHGEPGEPEQEVGKSFRALVAAGLVYANEAYWVEGAIQDVVFKKLVSNKMATESILMNLGYCLGHLVDELNKAISSLEDAEKDPALFGVARAQAGDGLMKYSKYLTRIADCWDKKEWKRPFSSQTNEMLEFAGTLLSQKKAAQEREADGNKVALAWAYLEASHQQFTFGEGPEGLKKFVASAIAFVNRALAASDEILRYTFAKWSGTDEEDEVTALESERPSQRSRISERPRSRIFGEKVGHAKGRDRTGSTLSVTSEGGASPRLSGTRGDKRRTLKDLRSGLTQE